MRRNRRNPRAGAAAVEFAVVLPLLMLLVFGMIEFGRMVMVQQMVVSSAREGARHAILDGATIASTKARAGNYLANAGVSTAVVDVTPDPNSASTATPITVDVRVSFEDVSWMPVPMFLGGKQIESRCVMFHE